MEQPYPVETIVGEAGKFSRKSREMAIERIVRVLKFLQEFHRAKTPPILNLDEHGWKQYFDDLPHYSLIQVGVHFKYLRQLFEDGNLVEGNFILKSGRPTESSCPPPSVVAENWLKPGWDTPGVEPQVHLKKTYKNLVGKTVTEAFDDSPERTEAFEDWLEERLKRSKIMRSTVRYIVVRTDQGRFMFTVPACSKYTKIQASLIYNHLENLYTHGFLNKRGGRGTKAAEYILTPGDLAYVHDNDDSNPILFSERARKIIGDALK